MNAKRRRPTPPGPNPALRPKTERTVEEAAIRIIGGTLRGRKLKIGVDPRTRPMKDRTRQAMFNLLGNHMDGCIAFDLFAGTGVIAMETVSRGAEKAVAIELLPHLAKTINQYLETFRIQDQVTVHRGNAFDFLADQREIIDALPKLPWCIFICPPFPLWESGRSELVALIESWLSAAPFGSRCVCELDYDSDPELLPAEYEWSVRAYRPAKLAITQKS